jgi:maltooligosyltrehalose trehalohydrolase
VHGRPVNRSVTPGDRFVVCLQNHDQIGNREAGDRITELTSIDLVQVGIVLILTSPFTPMLWMGEEWAASTPWPYFTSHLEPELAARSVQRRLDEFVRFDWDASRVIDPQDPAAFYDAKLKWAELAEPEHQQMLNVYRNLLALRRSEPDLADPRLDLVEVDYDEDDGWAIVHRGSLRVVINVSDEPVPVPVAAGEVLFATGSIDSAVDWLRIGPRSAAIVRAR